MPRLLSTEDEDYWNNRMTAGEAGLVALSARVTANENSLIGHDTRIGGLETWRSAKASAITNLGSAPTASTVDILGIQVPTGSSFSALITFVGTLKTKVDAILAALREREIIVT